MGSRGILLGAAVMAAVTLTAQTPAQRSRFFVLEEATIAGVHEGFKRGTLSCRGLVERYLQQIDRHDKQGAALNAIVEINPKARDEADALDKRFRQSGLTGPLHCVPAIVKDNFETIGLQSAAGSLAFKGFISSKDAFQVRRIKEAGAIVLAKSNMAEFAFTPYETVSSILPGYTRNPYALNRVTAGSSGGTAAAVAANFGLIGLGSDTGNSLRGPSSHTSLATIRSTMGLTSRAGVVPLNLLADIAGPMTRTLTDAVAVFQVIAGHDPDDPVTAAARDRAIPTYASSLRRDGLNGARIGVLRQAYESETTDPEIVKVFEAALADMRKAGAIIVDPVRVDTAGVRREQGAGPCGGFKYDMNRYLAGLGANAPKKNLEDIIRSRQFHPTVQQRLQSSQEGTENGPDTPGCQAEMKYRAAFRAAVEDVMDREKLDAFVYPTWSNVPRLIGDLNTPHGDNSQVFSPRSGNPSINVPMGYTRGNTLPIGVTFFGRAWDEATLIRLAYGYEWATKHRRPPVLVSSR